MTMTNTQKGLIAAGVASVVGVGAWLLWPSGAEAGTGDADDKNKGGSSTSSTVPLSKFFVRGTTKNDWQSVLIERTGEEEDAENGGLSMEGFRAPDAYASQHVWHLAKNALAALTRVQGDLVKERKSIVIVDAYRTLKRQAELRAEKPHLATARDEDSNHPKGLALDIRMYDPTVSEIWDIDKESTWGSQSYLAQVMGRHKWKQHSSPKEPWHFDFVG